MKVLTAAEVARNLGEGLDEIEREHQEVMVLRNRAVARLIPEPKKLNAMQVLGDLHGPLDEESATALQTAMNPIRRPASAFLQAPHSG